MKRREWIVAMLCVAMMVLAACQAKSPTAPSDTRDRSGSAPASGVNHESSYDDEVSAQLTASPTTIQKGQYSTLTWTTDEAEDVYLNGVSVDRSGSKNVYPTATTTYTLVAVDDDHRATSTVTVTVSGSDDDEISARLTASPTTIQAGQYSTLTWTTDEAEDVYLNGVSVDRSGSKNVYPTATTTYTLVAVHDDHRATSSATVTVSGTVPDPAPMPTATLTATPASIQSGEQTTLTWVTTNATSVTMNGSPVALNGSQVYSPTVTATYTLVATNAAGSMTATATVTVSAPAPPPPMPTASLTASPTTIQSGQSFTLSWITTDATSVTMNGNAVALNGSQVYSPTATTTYTLIASNAAGSTTATATVTVTIPPPMPTASLTASPATIQSGQSSTLSWVTTDATSVTLNGTAVALNGSHIDFPTATTTYTLVASNTSGSTTATATVTVTAPPPPPTPMPTASLTASPLSILTGESSTLSWTTTDATTVTLNGVPVSGTGMQVVSPTATMTYTLVASNATGSITRSATVTVTAPVVALTYLKDIKPIMDTNCVMCHSGPQPTFDYDVSTYAGVMTRVTPYDGNSRLIQMTKPGAPMHGFLNPDPAGRAEIIRRWIVDFGAPQQ